MGVAPQYTFFAGLGEVFEEELEIYTVIRVPDVRHPMNYWMLVIESELELIVGTFGITSVASLSYLHTYLQSGLIAKVSTLCLYNLSLNLKTLMCNRHGSPSQNKQILRGHHLQYEFLLQSRTYFYTYSVPLSPCLTALVNL